MKLRATKYFKAFTITWLVGCRPEAAPPDSPNPHRIEASAPSLQPMPAQSEPPIDHTLTKNASVKETTSELTIEEVQAAIDLLLNGSGTDSIIRLQSRLAFAGAYAKEPNSRRKLDKIRMQSMVLAAVELYLQTNPPLSKSPSISDKDQTATRYAASVLRIKDVKEWLVRILELYIVNDVDGESAVTSGLLEAGVPMYLREGIIERGRIERIKYFGK
jgi:hypothetical protein